MRQTLWQWTISWFVLVAGPATATAWWCYYWPVPCGHPVVSSPYCRPVKYCLPTPCGVPPPIVIVVPATVPHPPRPPRVEQLKSAASSPKVDERLPPQRLPTVTTPNAGDARAGGVPAAGSPVSAPRPPAPPSPSPPSDATIPAGSQIITKQRDTISPAIPAANGPPTAPTEPPLPALTLPPVPKTSETKTAPETRPLPETKLSLTPPVPSPGTPPRPVERHGPASGSLAQPQPLAPKEVSTPPVNRETITPLPPLTLPPEIPPVAPPPLPGLSPAPSTSTVRSSPIHQAALPRIITQTHIAEGFVHGYRRLRFYNYTDQELHLEIDGQQVKLPARSMLPAWAGPVVRWRYHSETRTETLGPQVRGLDVIFR